MREIITIYPLFNHFPRSGSFIDFHFENITLAVHDSGKMAFQRYDNRKIENDLSEYFDHLLEESLWILNSKKIGI
jgi:hypothetical protein